MSESESSDHAHDFVLVDRKGKLTIKPKMARNETNLVIDAQDPALNKIKVWLNPTDSDSPASEYRKHLHSHAAGTGEWIFETQQYRDWSQSDTVGNLWIRGIPGCGKSVVAASLISRLQRLDTPSVPVLFFFFREIIQTNRSPQSLVQDFCHKLIDHSPLLQANLKKLREDFPDELPFDKLWEALSTAVRAMEKIYCVVDALDEMELGHDQWLENFLNLGRQLPRSIKTIVTSRQVPHVEKHMFKIHLVDLRLDRRRVDRDISIYVSKRLENSQLNLPPGDTEMIMTAICERGNGLFLYARLMLDELLRNPEDLQSRVHNLPHGLGDMYSDILREHAASSGISSDLQRLILEWITHSTRPLRLLELAAMIEASPERIYFGSDVKLAIKTSCGPLLEICEDGVIQIIHHSLTEFILNRDVEHIAMNHQNREFAIIDSQAVHRKIAHTCIDYLTSGCFQQWKLTKYRVYEPKERQSLYLQFYFLRYATLEWPLHVAKAGDDLELLERLGEFCRDGNHDYEAWNDLWRAGQGEDVPQRCSALHVAAYTGLSSLAQCLLSQGADPDSKDDDGRTPLMYAVMKNHDKVVSILLRNKASHDKVVTGRYASTKHSLLYYACKLNHTPVVRALINGGVDPMAIENELRTSKTAYCEILEKTLVYGVRFPISALGCACLNGHVEAVRELMKHISPVNLCAGNLHLAAGAGKAETVAALLETEHVRLTINDRDSDGNTPLYLAACIRSASTIRVLLDHGADVAVRSLNRNSPPEPPVGMDPRFNFEASPSYTPLHGWCIGFPRDEYEFLKGQDMIPVLDLLLEAGCDINAKDYRGRTTLFGWPHLHWADMSAGEFVAALLDRGADATVVDDEGQTPLHSPNARPFERALRLLVNSGVDINAQRKKDGLTALMCTALMQNHTDPAVFHELKADFDLRDLEGNTAFHHYFRRNPAGKDCYLETWLSFSNLQIQNCFGRVPLHEFMYRQGGYVDMKKKELQPLLEMVKRGISLESKDGLGRTALLIALMDTKGTSLQFIEELLKLGANAQAVDYRGKSGESCHSSYSWDAATLLTSYSSTLCFQAIREESSLER
jgi:ankyrin repeat protein